MFRKTVALAMALGVVGAIGMPAAAGANWKHHAQEIQQSVNLGFTGQVRFQGGGGGVECQVTVAAQFVANTTTGNIHLFLPEPTSDTANCKGLGGWAFCQIHDVKPTGFPWVFHTTQSPASSDVTHGEIHSTATGGFCPVKSITVTAGTVVVTPNQPNTVSSVQVSGGVSVHAVTNSGASDLENGLASGTLNIEAPNANTYSI